MVPTSHLKIAFLAFSMSSRVATCSIAVSSLANRSPTLPLIGVPKTAIYSYLSLLPYLTDFYNK